MDFKSGKTGQYLRAQTLNAGEAKRMLALQALSHQYGTGSRGPLATMLLATLGGESATDNDSSSDGVNSSDDIHATKVVIEQIVPPMQDSANDSEYKSKEAI